MQLAAKQTFISAPDAADLRWYFATGRLQFEGKSNFGAMLERLEKFGTQTRPCLKCGGKNPVFDENGDTITPEKNGSGFVWSSEEWDKRKKWARLGILKGEVADAWGGDLVCKNCKGRGIVERRQGSTGRGGKMKVKAQSTTFTDADTGGDESLARLGYISRILDQVKARSQKAYIILESFYSPGGESEACLWHLTPSGKTMLRRNDLNLPERQFFANERNRQAENPNTERAMAFKAAEHQAKELHVFAVEVWCEVRA